MSWEDYNKKWQCRDQTLRTNSEFGESSKSQTKAKGDPRTQNTDVLTQKYMVLVVGAGGGVWA
jgi:hypothetical protein